jgi:hypothetical protein
LFNPVEVCVVFPGFPESLFVFGVATSQDKQQQHSGACWGGSVAETSACCTVHGNSSNAGCQLVNGPANTTKRVTQADYQMFDLSQRFIIVVKRLPSVNQAAFRPEDPKQGTLGEKRDAGKSGTRWSINEAVGSCIKLTELMAKDFSLPRFSCRRNNSHSRRPAHGGIAMRQR